MNLAPVPPSVHAAPPTLLRRPLDAMLAGIAEAVRGAPERRHAAVAEAIAAHVADPRLLEGRDCPCCPTNYVRHLLHGDAAASYAVIALVWRPGQMSPVHAHKTWCALAVHRGTLTETFYAAAEDDPVPTGTRLCPPGTLSCTPPDPNSIHRLANLSCREAVSIHCYGAAFDRLGDQVNLVYSA
ncbi:cysteine dioxygenase [Roseomonas sp. CCTCC AB2023176]|uniref:cysteine dioxygenase family protein n=1 Tax=Roseomonas sp. CCTCC AB2023176 TaxID=3342640 RepID=UPI0035E31201